MSLRLRLSSRRALGPDPRVAVMLERIERDARPAGDIRKGLTEYGSTTNELEKRLPPPYARAY
jgi:hypothetical protein